MNMTLRPGNTERPGHRSPARETFYLLVKMLESQRRLCPFIVSNHDDVVPKQDNSNLD